MDDWNRWRCHAAWRGDWQSAGWSERGTDECGGAAAIQQADRPVHGDGWDVAGASIEHGDTHRGQHNGERGWADGDIHAERAAGVGEQLSDSCHERGQRPARPSPVVLLYELPHEMIGNDQDEHVSGGPELRAVR